MLKITDQDKRKDDIIQISQICKMNKSNVMIFGNGVYAKHIAEYLIDNGINSHIQYVVDDEYFQSNQINEGTIAFSTFLSKYATISPLVFGVYDYDFIQKKREQYRNIILHMFDFHLTVVNNSIVNWNYDFYMEHMDRFEETYAMLCDEKSKRVMQTYLNAAINGEFHELYAGNRDRVPYFNERLQGLEVDTLFDCGAYDGDSAHDFIDAFPEYSMIYEFEPDPTNVIRIKQRVENEKIRDLRIIEKGVWSDTTSLRFEYKGKSSSSISNEGNVTIDVIKLDDLYDRFTNNSIIKMDIEGSELEALKGGRRIIAEYSPILAICVYHKKEDLITIPQYIASITEEDSYCYQLGYQGSDLAELVFYAIPR